MKKTLPLLLVCALTLSAYAIAPAPMATTKAIGLVPTAKKPASTILILNQSKALTDKQTISIVNLFSKMNLRADCQAATQSPTAKLVVDKLACADLYGAQRLIISIEKSPTTPQFVAVPGRYCAVNINDLTADKPNAPLLTTRIVKRTMKAFARVCGLGMSADRMCVMEAGSDDSLAKLDAVSASYGPNIYFPMQTFLKAQPMDYFIPFPKMRIKP